MTPAWASGLSADSRRQAFARGRTKVSRLRNTRQRPPTRDTSKPAQLRRIPHRSDPPHVHGKDGVDGSSPPECSANPGKPETFVFRRTCTSCSLMQVWSCDLRTTVRVPRDGDCEDPTALSADRDDELAAGVTGLDLRECGGRLIQWVGARHRRLYLAMLGKGCERLEVRGSDLGDE